ncbi:hypothetical protein EUAN_02420 [Andreesenia angusta]|uniref:Uncharacterized protein n=1 Tax=Andreesenia angusta TaxID=39480 RepID=A0A1S1V9W9_9FIRM|nr:hypothetical protein [Andreesenia angusta]OHW63378.1 hypothetical protein EUAN_02420 [Andreesenia angusta]
MATSSFDKKFTLDTEKAVDSFVDIFNNPVNSIKIDRSLASAEKSEGGTERLKKILSL